MKRERDQATAKHRAECRRYRESAHGRRMRRRWWRAWIAKPENRRKHNDRRRDLAMKAAGVTVSSPPTLEGVWKVARGKCWLCGLGVKFPGYHDPDDPDSRASIDHVVPISKGGAHHFKNSRLAHFGCNRKRGNREVPVVSTAPIYARRTG